MLYAELRLVKKRNGPLLDPLIYNQVDGVPTSAEIGLSGGLQSFAGYPVGTRPTGQGAEPFKV